MVEKDAHERWVIRFAELMSNSPVAVHRHVADRLAVLLGMAEVAWVDGQLEDENMSASGTLAVFTDSLVAIVTLDNEMRGGIDRLGGPLRGGTSVIVLPRKSLTEVKLMAGEPDDHVNDAYRWARWTPDGRPNQEGWPTRYAPVELVYPGRSVTLNLQIGAGREGFDEFMASVMVDLTK